MNKYIHRMFLLKLLISLSQYVENKPQEDERTKRWGLVSKAIGPQFEKDAVLVKEIRDHMKREANKQEPWKFK